MAKTPEELRQYMHAWYIANRARIAARAKAFYEKDIETSRAIKRAAGKKYREKHPEKVKTSKKAYHERHPERVRAAQKISNRAWHLANPEKRRAHGKLYRQRHPEKVNANRRRRRHANPEKTRAESQAYRQAHPEEVRQRERAYRQAHPEKVRDFTRARRARKKGAPIDDLSPEQWREIQDAFSRRCVYCPADCKACKKKTHKLTPDHVTPYKHNGSNTLWNVVPACLSCNIKKNAGPPPKPVQPLLLTIAPSKKPKAS